MKITDLKTGNLISYRDRVYMITEILRDDTEYRLRIRNSCGTENIPARIIKPIKIDSLWLMTFGFVKMYESDDAFIRFERSREFLVYDIDFRYANHMGGLKLYGNRVPCRYVHEFQNFFFRLFGREAFEPQAATG